MFSNAAAESDAWSIIVRAVYVSALWGAGQASGSGMMKRSGNDGGSGAAAPGRRRGSCPALRLKRSPRRQPRPLVSSVKNRWLPPQRWCRNELQPFQIMPRLHKNKRV